MSSARGGGAHIFLIGMMGCGKTTVARLLATRLGRAYVDIDEKVEASTGTSVADYFKAKGEAAFRAEERDALRRAVAARGPAVIAAGGGVVLDPGNRDLIATSGMAVFLRARPETLAARIGDGSGRPLIDTALCSGPQPRVPEDPSQSVLGVVERLLAERQPLYEQLAHAVVDVDGLEPGAVTARVAAALVRAIHVDLGARSYDVVVGPGASLRLDGLLPVSARRAVVVTQEHVGFEPVLSLPYRTCFVGEGEAEKSLSSVERLCRAFAGFGLTREDVVVAVGGGLVTDLAGFAASVYHRGTAVVHVATTLLAQVDAAIGGKTGANLPEGKNLVGSFWQPHGVVCDTDTLASLPAREWRSGLGEMAKYAFLGVDGLDRLPLAEQVARCVEAKAAVVAGDEREDGLRVVLNYGHTLAHALEACGFAEHPASGRTAVVDLRHGEAVAIGLVFAARLARRLGRIDDERVQRHLDLVQGYGLACEVPEAADRDELISFMARDKKATRGLTFVLDGPHGVEAVSGLDPGLVHEVLAERAKGS